MKAKNYILFTLYKNIKKKEEQRTERINKNKISKWQT